MLSSLYGFSNITTCAAYVVCICKMVHSISYTKNEFKNVAAQPTGWEVGGGPPGAAQGNLTGFF